MGFKGLKWYKKVLVIIMIIISLPFIALGFIIYFFIFILPAPIEIVKYKKSAFYNKYNKKYRFGITKTMIINS